jgi:hypothetical protein
MFDYWARAAVPEERGPMRVEVFHIFTMKL